ncbi:peptidoglycan-binding protein [Kineosporia sp. NBRC 101731]|uniref:peptidoglycan-binding protein n=1 Tax=Kineosporia sp. NBRC 101731 TaxID=3032199 RepID=UPI002555BE58|nr:peptidoglycan-binding protein [Kineosporia sp. NBRC 101731]
MKQGHTDPRYDGEPALGRVSNLRLNAAGDVLLGDLTYPEDLDGDIHIRYPSRSVEADLGVETADGDRFGMVVSGLALLGETKPAIQSLAELGPREEWEPVEYVAAMSVAASMPLLATWEENLHPRGGGKFVKKGSGYSKQGKGDQAPQVRALQTELIRLGFLSADSGKNGGVDGLFGPKTEAAVRAWQKAAGNMPTGRVTPALLDTLKDAKKGADPKAFSQARKAKRRSMKKTAPDRGAGKAVDRVAKVAAAEEFIEGLDDVEGLHVRDVTVDAVVFAAGDGRVWLSDLDEDTTGSVQIGEMCPAVASYTELAPTPAGLAAHNMHSGVASLAAGLRPLASGDTTLDAAQLREALGLADDATEDDILAAARTRREQGTEQPPATPPAPVPGTEPATPETTPAPQIPAQPTTPEQTPTVPAQPADVAAIVREQLAAALAPIQEAQAQKDAAYETRIGELSTELATRRAKEATDHKSSVFASAIQQGKITPAQKADWEADFDKDPVVTERILARMAPGTAMPVASTGYVGDAETDTALATFDADFTAVMGFSPNGGNA